MNEDKSNKKSNTPIPMNASIDHLSWFKETLIFSKKDLEAELLAQIEEAKSEDMAKKKRNFKTLIFN